MNKTILSGRLTANPEVRYTNGVEPMAIARYTLAVDRETKKDGQPTADFIRCVAMGKGGQFAEKYLSKGQKILIEGKIRTGSYDDKDGKKVYTTEVYVDRHEFCESKKETAPANNDGIPEGFQMVDESDIPF